MSAQCFLGPCLVVFVLFLRLHLRHHFADEIVLFLLDARAHFVAHELHDLGAGPLEQLLDGDVLVLDEGLAQQGDFRQVLAQPAFHHLGDDLGRLLFALGLLGQDFALLVEHLGRHIAGIDVGGIHGRDMHRQVARQGFIAALQCHHAADAGAMDVGAQRARAR